MAEIAVLLVLKKIAIALARETLSFAKPFLAKKSESVAALPNDMKLIGNELELIRAFLKEIGRKGWKGEVIETWIGQVRRLAYDMEDVVDHFIYVVGKHNQIGSWWDYMKKIAKKPQRLFSLDEIASEIKRIKQELKQLSESRDRWTKPTDGGTDIPAGSYETENEIYLPGHDYSISDDELVGIDKNKQTLISSLNFEDPSLRIIAVWGMGGIGKSTLVNNVYKNEGSKFDCRAWVSISQSYKLEDIWKKMLTDLVGKDKKEFDTGTMDSAEIRVQLRNTLDKKRYLIILDDIWTPDVLFRIKKVVADNGLGSRVIITTRFEEVASLAEDSCKIKLEPLGFHDSWHVFCKKAFPKVESHICPSELHQCGKNIVEKCDGLPLALVAIGSILSLRPKNIDEWKLFYDQLIWELHNNKNLSHVEKIINLSYKHLPDYLKNCFLYCAMFPEDYLIHRKRLIRLWIAEGFIEHKGACSLEDTAESYLRELVRRSMLHVAKRNSFGRIKCIRMHDLVRELAIFQSKREGFSITYDGNNEAMLVGSDSRRMAVLQCSKCIPSSIDPSRLRTFIALDTSGALSSWYSFISCKPKYIALAVLDLSGLPIETIPNSIGELFNLRLLCLDNTKVKELPKSITQLQNLQTLSIQNAQLVKFPQGLSKLKKLRHLLVSRLQDENYLSLNYREAVEPFKGLWSLTDLQTLWDIKASEVFVAKLGNLSQLRCLGVFDVRSKYCAQLCISLSKMCQLSRLTIKACDEDELLLLDDMTFPNPLQMLDLIGRLSEGAFTSPFFLNHGKRLHRLILSCSQLSENSVPRLSELSNLTELVLVKAYTGQELYFQADWFPNLKVLYLVGLPYVNQIRIHERALASLEYLCIDCLPELREAPVGFRFLKSLNRVFFFEMHPDFASNIRKESLDHIPYMYTTTAQGKKVSQP